MATYFKIPLILIATTGVHISTTPPHPLPEADEGAPSSRLEIVVKQRSGAFIFQTITGFAALAEIVVILASHPAHLPHRTERYISRVFVFSSGGAARLHLSVPFFAGVFLISAAAVIRRACYRALGRLFTFEMTIRKDHRLITHGPYAVVRHPGYMGILLMVAGLLLWHTGKGSWLRECGVLDTSVGRVIAVLFTVLLGMILTGLMTRMSMEDEALRKLFGEEWESYADRVPCRLFPGVY